MSSGERRVLSLWAGCALMLVACSRVFSQGAEGAETAAPVVNVADTTKSVGAGPSSEQEFHKWGNQPFHQGKPFGLIHLALAELELTWDQREAIEKLQEPTPDDAELALHKVLLAALAEQVTAGKVDPARLEEPLAHVEASVAARNTSEAVALDGLHEQLNADQRARLVAMERQKRAESAAALSGFLSPSDPASEPSDGTISTAERLTEFPQDVSAVKQVLQDVSAVKRVTPRLQPELGDPPTSQNSDTGDRPILRLVRELDLSAAQLAKLEALEAGGKNHDIVLDSRTLEEKIDSFLDAFVSESFDAEDNLPELPMAGTMHEWFELDVAVLQHLVPKLTRVQRNQLAKRLKQGPHAWHGLEREGRGIGAQEALQPERVSVRRIE